jgi:hypothetical protein
MAYQRDEALTTCSTKNRPFWTLAGVLANCKFNDVYHGGVLMQTACGRQELCC